MKTTLKLSLFTFCMALLMPVVNAQGSDANKSGLVSTAWRMVQNVVDSAHSERTMYFKKDFTFESRNLDGSVFNGGRYRLIDDKTFVTVHYDAQTANLFNFTIKNDTLHFKGNFIDPYFPENDDKTGFSPIEEIFVRINDWVDEDRGIKFSGDSLLSTALARSAKEGKLIFMDCYTSWCGPCKYLARNIFPLSEVGDFYNSHFINLTFDMEKGEGINIAKNYGIHAFPTLLFLNAAGETVHVGLGALDANTLIELGKTALDDTQNLRSILKKIKAGDKSVQTLTLYLKNNYYATDKDALLNEYFKTASAQEKLSKDAWYLFKNYINDIDNDQFRYFLRHRSAYEKKFGKKEVNVKILMAFSYYQQRYNNNPVKAASVKSIDPALYSEFLIVRDFIDATRMLQSKKEDKGNWDNYITKVKAYLSLDSTEPMAINDVCWKIYENYRTFNDTTTLRLAKDWQEKAYNALPNNHPINDTYAHILFDLGYVKEAIEHEESAIKIATELNNTKDLKFYTAEIEIFRKKL